MTTDEKLLLIATHELGHAIVWHTAGLPLVAVRLRPGWIEPDGDTELDFDKPKWTQAEGHAYLVGLLAGPVAGRTWAKQTGQRYPERRDSGDLDLYARYRREHDWAKNIPGKRFWSEATTAVQKHWSRITQLAPRLVENGRLHL